MKKFSRIISAVLAFALFVVGLPIVPASAEQSNSITLNTDNTTSAPINNSLQITPSTMAALQPGLKYDDDLSDTHLYIKIDEPIAGAKPDFTINTVEIYNPSYGITEERIIESCRITWTEVETGKEMTSADSFVAGRNYKLAIFIDYLPGGLEFYSYINGDYANKTYIGITSGSTASGYTYKLDKPYYLPKTGYKVIEVDTFEELKAALEAPGEACVRLTGDIYKIIKPIVYMRKGLAEEEGIDLSEEFDENEYYLTYYDNWNSGEPTLEGVSIFTYYYENDPQMQIKGNKVLELNGYYINVGDNTNVTFDIDLDPAGIPYRVTEEGITSGYERTLLTVTEGSTLTIRDSSGGKGTIHYDAYMVTTTGGSVFSNNRIYKDLAIRDIVKVESNATLVVNSGTLEAGRSKEQWIVDGCLDATEIDDDGVIQGGMFNGNAYQQIWGSAIQAEADSRVFINGGTFFGRGSYTGDVKNEIVRHTQYGEPIYADVLYKDTYRDAVIDGHTSATVVINGGYFSAKGGADIFNFNNGTIKKYYVDSSGMPGHLTIRQGSFSIQTVDYIRGMDSMATNDSETMAWVLAGVGAAVGLAISAITGPIGLAFSGVVLTAGLGAVGGVTGGMIFNVSSCCMVSSGTFGEMNIYPQYVDSIEDRARYSVQQTEDSEIEFYNNRLPDSFGWIMRIDPHQDGSTEKLFVDYADFYNKAVVDKVYWNDAEPVYVSANYTPYYSSTSVMDDHDLVYTWKIQGTVNGNKVNNIFYTSGNQDYIDPHYMLDIDGYYEGSLTVTCLVSERRSEAKNDGYYFVTNSVEIIPTKVPVIKEALPGGDFDIEVVYPTSGDVTWQYWPIQVYVRPTAEALDTATYDYTQIYQYQLEYINDEGETVVLTSKNGEFLVGDLDRGAVNAKVTVLLYSDNVPGRYLETEVSLLRHLQYEAAGGEFSKDKGTFNATGSSVLLKHPYYNADLQPSKPAHKVEIYLYKQVSVDAETGEITWEVVPNSRNGGNIYINRDQAGVYAYGAEDGNGNIVYSRPINIVYDPNAYNFRVDITGNSVVSLTKNSVISQPTFTAVATGSANASSRYRWAIIDGPVGWKNSGLSTKMTAPAGESATGSFLQIFGRGADEDEILPGTYVIQAYRLVSNSIVAKSELISIEVQRTADSCEIYIDNVEAGDYYQVLKGRYIYLDFAPADNASLPAMSNIQYTVTTMTGTNVGRIVDGIFLAENYGRVKITATATTSSGTVSDSIYIDVPIDRVEMTVTPNFVGTAIKDFLTVDPNAPYTITVSGRSAGTDPDTVFTFGYPYAWVKVTPKEGYSFFMLQDQDVDTPAKFRYWYAVQDSVTFAVKNSDGTIAECSMSAGSIDGSYGSEGVITGQLFEEFVAYVALEFPYVYKTDANYIDNVQVNFDVPLIGDEYGEDQYGICDSINHTTNVSSSILDSSWVEVQKVNANAAEDTDPDNDGDVSMDDSAAFEEGQLYRIRFILIGLGYTFFDESPAIYINGELPLVYDLNTTTTPGTLLGDKNVYVYYYFYAATEPETISNVGITGVPTPEANKLPPSADEIEIGIGGASTYSLRSLATRSVQKTDELQIDRLVWFVDVNYNNKFDEGEDSYEYFNRDGTFKNGVAYCAYIVFSAKDRDGDGKGEKVQLADDLEITIGGLSSDNVIKVDNNSVVCKFEETAPSEYGIQAELDMVELNARPGYTITHTKTFAINSTGVNDITGVTAEIKLGNCFTVSADGMNVTITLKPGIPAGVYTDFITIVDENKNAYTVVPVVLTVEDDGHEHNYVEFYDENNHWKKCACGEIINNAAHTQALDDGNCTTAITCIGCSYVMVAKKDAHAPGVDDNNCTTPVICTNPGCTIVTTPAKSAHVPAGDDNNCETPIICTNPGCLAETTPADTHDFTAAWQRDKDGHWHVCANAGCTVTDTKVGHTSSGPATETKDESCTLCGFIISPALNHTHNYNTPNYNETYHWNECACGAKDAETKHIAGEDDGNCLTPVICTGCSAIAIAAKSAHEAGEDDGDCTTDVKCKNCNSVAIPGNAEHTPVADDGDCTTATLCSDCGKILVEAKDAHSGGIATCQAKAKCENCGSEYGENAAHLDNNSDGACDYCSTAMGGSDLNPEDPNKTKGLPGGAIAAIVIGSVIVLGAGGFSIFWFVVKKKTMEELIALIKSLANKPTPDANVGNESNSTETDNTDTDSE